LLLVLAVAPVAGFCYFLTTLGLDPLPSSVTAKLTNPEADGSLTGMIGARMQIILETRAQQVLAAFIAVGAVLLFVKPVWTSTRWPLLFAVGGAGVAHFLFGRFDWMDRYENYILVTMAAGLLAVAAGTKLRGLPLLVLAPILFAGYSYVPGVMEQYPPAGRAVRLQQAQMARLVQEHLKEPVAVNDLGWVAWRNPNYVLDLWGLANHEARALRLTDPHPGWADELVKAQGVNFAMLYGFWFDDAIGDEWVLLGQLKTTGPVDYLGSNFVDVYLTGPVDPAPYLTALADWKAGLPKGALFDFAEGFAQ
jgi:hypothetical protein